MRCSVNVFTVKGFDVLARLLHHLQSFFFFPVLSALLSRVFPSILFIYQAVIHHQQCKRCYTLCDVNLDSVMACLHLSVWHSVGK